MKNVEIQNKIVTLMDKAFSQKKEKETESQRLLESINDYILDELRIKLPPQSFFPMVMWTCKSLQDEFDMEEAGTGIFLSDAIK